MADTGRNRYDVAMELTLRYFQKKTFNTKEEISEVFAHFYTLAYTLEQTTQAVKIEELTGK